MVRSRAGKSSNQRNQSMFNRLRQRKEEYLPYVLAVAISIALIFLFQSNGIINGAIMLPIGKENIVDSGFVQPCTDIDAELNVYVKGVTKYGRMEYTDYCQENKVIQWYCASSNTVRQVHGFECPKGCQNGVCLR